MLRGKTNGFHEVIKVEVSLRHANEIAGSQWIYGYRTHKERSRVEVTCESSTYRW